MISKKLKNFVFQIVQYEKFHIFEYTYIYTHIIKTKLMIN